MNEKTHILTQQTNPIQNAMPNRLTLTKDRIQQINPQAKVFLYGQKLNPQTWAIARSDMLILEPEGKDAENIKLGSTLSNDRLSDKRRSVSEIELALAA